MTTKHISRTLSRSFCERFFLQAVCLNHVFVVSEILHRGDIDINICSNHGQSALSLAAERGHNQLVILLLSQPLTEVNAQDADGQTALGWAVFNGHVEVVSTLLENAAVRTDITDVDGMTPLSWAVAKGRSDSVVFVLLLERLGLSPHQAYSKLLISDFVAVGPVEI